jgi:hypothetical protein
MAHTEKMNMFSLPFHTQDAGPAELSDACGR